MSSFSKILFFTLSIITLSLYSCTKESRVDQNFLALQQMETTTDSLVNNANITGIVALVVDHKRGIDWSYTAGYSNLASREPMDINQIFRIGSNTKTMTGTVVLQLVDEGLLSLDDKLSKFFPEFPRSNEVTIAMLSNMTSGIYNYTADNEWGEQFMNNPTRVWSPLELVNIGSSHTFNFNPGSDWSYSNTNTIILGLIVEKLTNHSLEYEINRRLFSPLGLSNTAFITKGRELPLNHCNGYVWDDESDDYINVTTSFDLSWAWAAGSVYSTPRELQQYVERLVEGGFLSSNLQSERLTKHVSLDSKNSYGFNILKRGSFFGHNGGLPGYTSSMYHSKEKKCTVIIYFNCYADLQPDYLFFRFMDILYNNDY